MSQTKTKNKLVLLDAHAIIHRAYHALPDFATSKGEPTGALYGLVLMILKIVDEFKPDYLVACFDLPKPTYRHQVFEGYKAHRAKTDDSLSVQLEKAKDVCRALNIPIYALEGFEADDMLGTIVEELSGGDTDIVIASGDMDTLQLVNDGKKEHGSVKVYTLKKGIKDTILYDEKAVFERFGFPPKLLPDFKGLKGDPSDNIVGIEGIGDKSATDLIKYFGSIESIYKELKNPKSEIHKKTKPRIIKLLEEGKEEAAFSKMLATIRRDAPIDFKLPDMRWSENLNMQEAKELFYKLEFRSIGDKLQSAIHALNGKEVNGELGKKEDPNKEVSEEDLEETSVALWVVDSNITDPKLADILNFANTEDFSVAREKIFNELEKRGSKFIFEEIEKPLIPILKEVKRYGVLVNSTFLQALAKDYVKELEVVEKKIWRHAGLEFNVSSPKQLGEVLFEKMGLTVKNQKKTGTGAKSTRESELEKMISLHPIVPLILEYREIRKLLSTYIEPIPKLLDEEGRLHARFIQAGSTTGRMASENPNLQNIPVGSERGRRIRYAFIAPEGSSLVSLDYSQIELRIAAILSQDKNLIDIFKTGKDIHSAVAAQVFKVKELDVTKEMRRQAKVINFGILYGMGVTALQANLGTDRKTAGEFLSAYFKNFSGLADYIENIKKETEKQGYTKTIFGRRRYFEGIKSKLPFIKAAAERMAVNAAIQGTQADIIKIAMNKIDQALKKEKTEAHLLMQIHDELIYEVKDGEIEKFTQEAKNIMENILNEKQSLGVPIVANYSSGKNWGEMQ